MNTSPFRKYGKLSNALALLSLCFMLSVGINAQHKLNAQELKLFKQSAKNKIAELQNCISTVVDKKLDDYTRDKSIQSAVKLFIEGAKMQVSTLLPQGNKALPTTAFYTKIKQKANYNSFGICRRRVFQNKPLVNTAWRHKSSRHKIINLKSASDADCLSQMFFHLTEFSAT